MRHPDRPRAPPAMHRCQPHAPPRPAAAPPPPLPRPPHAFHASGALRAAGWGAPPPGSPLPPPPPPASADGKGVSCGRICVCLLPQARPRQGKQTEAACSAGTGPGGRGSGAGGTCRFSPECAPPAPAEPPQQHCRVVDAAARAAGRRGATVLPAEGSKQRVISSSAAMPGRRAAFGGRKRRSSRVRGTCSTPGRGGPRVAAGLGARSRRELGRHRPSPVRCG